MTKEIVKLAAARIVKNEMQKRALVDSRNSFWEQVGEAIGIKKDPMQSVYEEIARRYQEQAMGMLKDEYGYDNVSDMNMDSLRREYESELDSYKWEMLAPILEEVNMSTSPSSYGFNF